MNARNAKTCLKCHVLKPHKEFSIDRAQRDGLSYRCRDCWSVYRQLRKVKAAGLAHSTKWRRENPRKYRAAKLRHRMKKYGITLQIYEVMLEAQDRKCVICLSPFTETRYACVDHCHSTEKVRGLLCRRCNQGIGLWEDDPNMMRRGAAYLEAQ